MKAKNILITGTNGFIGSNISAYLIKRNFNIISLSRIKPQFDCKWYEFIDINYKSFEPIFKDNQIDHIVHCAAIAHKNLRLNKKENIHLINEINIKYTELLISLSKNYNVKKFIFISSISVYYQLKSGTTFINEKSEIRPNNIYGKSKYIAEKAIINNFRNSQTNFTILRLPLVYGVDCPGNLNKLIRLVDLNIPLPFGNFTNERSLLSIYNLISAVETSIKSVKTKNKIYLISDKEKISTKGLILLIAQTRKRFLILFNLPKFLLKIISKVPTLRENFSKLQNNIIIQSNSFFNDTKWEPPFQQEKELIKCFKKTK